MAGRKASALLPWLCAACLLGGLELALRLGGFRYARYPVAMRYVMTLAHGGAQQRQGDRLLRLRYRLDPVLLWRPEAQPGVTNSEGFLGPEWTPARRGRAARVMALGDSCTVAGDDPYPAVLGERLGAGWEVWNAGVGSWSSYQGRKALEALLPRYRPDVVTVYFGWNDHWLAWAAPDKDMAAHLERQWRALQIVEKSRLLQLLLRGADRLRGGLRLTSTTPPRVNPDDYEANLRAMVAAIKASGGEPVLITAPTTLDARHPVARRLCEETRNFHDPARIEPVHTAYNDRVRRVAADTGATLVDLARAFSAMPDAPRLFADGIHLTAEGHRRAAALLEPAVRGSDAASASGRRRR